VTWVEVECAPDGSWLRVGDRELRSIRGQQQDFVLTITRRNEFFEFFAQEGASAGSSLTLATTQAKPAKCERGSIRRPGWPGSSMKPKCW